MKILLILWLGCLLVMTYHLANLRKSGIYPSKKVLRARVVNWGIAGVLFFFIWCMMLLVR